MIPADSNDLLKNLDIVSQPSYTYKYIGSKYCDGLEAMEQAIYLILNVERYKYVIYSWNYGIELQDLFGKPKSYVIPELERRITEALIHDDRINSVENFNFKVNKNIVEVSFTVNTNLGDVKISKEVKV